MKRFLFFGLFILMFFLAIAIFNSSLRKFILSYGKYFPGKIALFNNEVDMRWMEIRINEELKNFSDSSIKAQDIDKAFAFSKNQNAQNVSYLLMKISILNNLPVFEADSEVTMKMSRAILVKDFFLKICAKYKLPDMELLFSLHDEFDNLPGSWSFKDAEELNLPIFVFAKNIKSKNRILFPDFEAFNNDSLIHDCKKAAKKHLWDRKKEIIFFRGATTNKLVTINNFKENPRFHIVYLSQQFPNLVDASFTFITENYKNFPSNIFVKSGFVSMQDHFAYKYLIDIDGNSCTYSRCRWIMLSNSVLLKCESNNIQWYYDLFKPYVNYIPIKEDLSDLQSQIVWLKKHDNEAKKISKNASVLGKEIFNSKAVELYAVKLLNQYAKRFDSESMTK